MKYRTSQLAQRFVDLISSWPGVECIMVNEDAEADALDPYFALNIDVFGASVPDAAVRAEAYAAITIPDGAIAALESTQTKDRFLVGSIPIHIEFKEIDRIEEVINIAAERHDQLYLIKDAGTYGFYRLMRAKILFNRGSWIKNVHIRLSNLDERFWSVMRDSNQSKMEHFLIDLGTASLQGDDFNSLVSASGFIKSACLTLFCINKRFEPSHRAYYNQVLSLPLLPESFSTKLDAFLRPPSGADRRYILAKAIALGIVALEA